MYDLLIKGGLVLDPSQGINDRRDVAVYGGRIAAIEPSIPQGGAKRILDAGGLVVSPGLVDLHAHVAHGVIKLSIDPEKHCLLKGTTTVVDAGSTGELNFEPFRRYVADPARVRILAFLNVESLGMIEFADARPDHTDQDWPKLLTDSDERFAEMFVNLEIIGRTIKQNRDVIVGIKWAHHGLKTMALAREAADSAGCRLMMENRFMPEASRFLRRGDILTHIYHQAHNPHSGYVDGLLQGGRIPSEFFELSKQGVVFDVGHGQGSFSWKVAEAAFGAGLRPHTISSDLWTGNVGGPVYDLPTVMSKFLCLGMSVEEVFRASTSAAASAIGRADDLGTLRPGSPADVGVFRLREGAFAFEDCYGEVREGERLITPVHVLKSGAVVLRSGRGVLGSPALG